jgi:AraC-like DNA-binding protein
MNIQRIEESFDGCLRPVCTAPPLLTSSGTSWAGFLLERDFCRGGHARTILYPHTSLILVTTGWVDVHLHGSASGRHAVNTVTVRPAGFEAHNVTWTPRQAVGGATEMIRVEVDPAVLSRLIPDEDCGRQATEPQLGLDDPSLASLIRIMEAEVATGCPTGAIYAESICLALLTRLQSCCGPRTAPTISRVRKLSSRQMERVDDFIEANLGSRVALTELAALLDLSAGHFLAVFKATAGVTPHRYVVDKRVARAKAWLTEGRASIAHIATELGFASQSHFTETFRRAVGTTPSRFRRTS